MIKIIINLMFKNINKLIFKILSCEKALLFIYFILLLNCNVTCNKMLSLYSGLTVIMQKRVHFTSNLYIFFLYKPWQKVFENFKKICSNILKVSHFVQKQL